MLIIRQRKPITRELRDRYRKSSKKEKNIHFLVIRTEIHVDAN